jgi:hypothetical protein
MKRAVLEISDDNFILLMKVLDEGGWSAVVVRDILNASTVSVEDVIER